MASERSRRRSLETCKDGVSEIFGRRPYELGVPCRTILRLLGNRGRSKGESSALYFEGAAIRWYRWLLWHQGKPDWETLVREITSRFGPSTYLDYNVELSRIKQTGTVVEYQKNFEALTNMVCGWPIEALIGAFVRGLKDEILIETGFEIARTVEEKNKRLHITSRGTISKNWSNVRSSPQESMKSEAFPHAVGRNKTGNAPQQKRDDKAYVSTAIVPGCRGITADMYLVDDGDDPPEADEDFPLAAKANTVEERMAPEISLHALVGDEVLHLMRVEGKLCGRKVCVLIDTGSTHNFICEKSA
ncbi:hypothetical protein EJ110_NYTH49409 [Nymphaea thermarum]|nr:hypothetical protein EJ110_NYTH49409 [Nymphaea thermarum]